MYRSTLALAVVCCFLTAACITGKEPDADGTSKLQDGAPVVDGPLKPDPDGGKQDKGKDTGKDKGKDSAKDNGGPAVPGKWVQIKVKSFSMGAAPGEPCSDQSLERQHQVTLTHNFEMQTTEVTQDQFTKLMGYNRSYFKSCGGSCPADSVSWHEAAAYCNKLSQIRGVNPCYGCSGSKSSTSCHVLGSYKTIYDCVGYRLPTEAEWEFAYRAGTQTAFYSGAITSATCQDCIKTDAKADKIGWYCANSGSGGFNQQPHVVGGKSANAWGLFDMAGNLQEWTADGWVKDLGSTAVKDPYDEGNSTYKVVKGGSWEYRSYKLRAAYRDDGKAAYGTILIGFRCVRTRP